jgi:ElaB/YqjD/DUF883 family membrane-anchored ribosome-binding protein
LEKSPDEIERDMARTRDSISEKVSQLESQVKDTLSSVSGTVEAVRDAVASAPTVVSDTVRNTVEAVKETVRSFDVVGCIRNNPWAAVGTTALAGFATGLFLGGGRQRPIPAQATEDQAPRGLPGPVEPVAASPREEPGFLDHLFGLAGRELRQVAETALAAATAALKENINTMVPGLVETAVHKVADATGRPNGTTRVNGPDYAARG